MSRTGAVVRSYVGVLVFAAFVFLGARRLDLVSGWLYVGLALVGTTLTHLLTPAGSDLAAERAAGAAAGEAWDRRLLGALFLTSLVGFVVAGADAGRPTAPPPPPAVQGAGAALMLAGQLLFALARRENAWFSSTVRILEDRGHAVCASGPYRWVRHPGYLGLLLSTVAFPLVLGSRWAAFPTLASVALLLARTAREDQFLHARLAGYADYARTTRWRLLPGLW